MAFEPQGPAVNHERIQFSSGERNRAADSPEYTVLLPTRGACSPYSPGTPKKNCSSRSRSSRNRIRTPMWSVYRSSSFSARPNPAGTVKGVSHLTGGEAGTTVSPCPKHAEPTVQPTATRGDGRAG